MRKSLLLPLLALGLIFFVSCQKEYSFDDPSNTGGTGGTGTGGGTGGGTVTGEFKAKINGVQWVANQVAQGTRTANGLINLTGTSTDGKIITITLSDSDVHVYTLSQQTMSAGAYSPGGNSISYTSNASNDPARAGGSVTISSINTTNKKMNGTFRFKAFKPLDSTTVDITEGSFTNLSYTTDAVPPPTSNTDTFRVKLDGVAWTNYSVIATLIPQFNKLAITSNSDANGSKNIGFQMANNITPGSYVWDLINLAGVYNPTNSLTNPTPYMADGGNLTILEHNTTTKRIRGTFNFPATQLLAPGTILFTEGYFAVTYQ